MSWFNCQHFPLMRKFTRKIIEVVQRVKVIISKTHDMPTNNSIWRMSPNKALKCIVLQGIQRATMEFKGLWPMLNLIQRNLAYPMKEDRSTKFISNHIPI